MIKWYVSIFSNFPYVPTIFAKYADTIYSALHYITSENKL